MNETIIQTIAALAGVVGLIVLVAFVLKRKAAPDGLMKLVEYRSFGPKRGIAALRAGGQVLLIGVTQTEFRLLTSFKESEFGIEGPEKPEERLQRLKSIKESIR